jgi:hypothetical protein
MRGEIKGGRIPISMTSDSHQEPDVAYNLNMNEYFVVYNRPSTVGGDVNVYGRRITWDGAYLSEIPIDTSGNDQFDPAVAAYRLNRTTPYLVVFSDQWNNAFSGALAKNL